jgi:hypothetical protein
MKVGSVAGLIVLGLVAVGAGVVAVVVVSVVVAVVGAGIPVITTPACGFTSPAPPDPVWI